MLRVISNDGHTNKGRNSNNVPYNLRRKCERSTDGKKGKEANHRILRSMQAKNIIKEVHEGSCRMYLGPRNGAKIRKSTPSMDDELPQVLWTHRTTPKSSNGETPFTMVYGSEAVIPIEISMETKRIQDFDPKENEKRQRRPGHP
nr:hypothetical protein [Tanacetum cinerariifolium]